MTQMKESSLKYCGIEILFIEENIECIHNLRIKVLDENSHIDIKQLMIF
jgi:hypothetical protein